MSCGIASDKPRYDFAGEYANRFLACEVYRHAYRSSWCANREFWFPAFIICPHTGWNPACIRRSSSLCVSLASVASRTSASYASSSMVFWMVY